MKPEVRAPATAAASPSTGSAADADAVLEVETAVRRQRNAAAVDAARAVLGAARTQEMRHAFLARASMVLGTSLDSAATAGHIARLAVPELADLCILDLVHGERLKRRVAIVHAEAGVEAQLQPLLRQRRFDAASPQAAALEEGKAQLGFVSEDAGLPWPESGLEGRTLRALGIRSYAVLPLRSRGQMLGLLTLLSTARRSYTADEFATASEFVHRASVALDNALLYESAIHARAAAEVAKKQFQSLVNGFRDSEDKYRILFEESRDAVYITQRDGRLLDVNSAAVELFGYRRGEMLALNARELYADPADRERFRAEIDGRGAVRDFPLTLRRKDGSLVRCLLSSMVRRSPTGEVTGYQGIIRDITDRARAEEKLRESEHFARTIISSVRQGVIVYDTELRYQVWNRFMEEITGLRAEDVIGTHCADIFPHLREQGIDVLLERALRGETVRSPDTPFHVPQTGKSGWVTSVYSPHIAPDGSVIGVVAIIHDITERKRAERQLLHNAFHDALTGLPNRALFVDRLERLLSHTARHPDFLFGIAFLDLDRFKVVNDSLGHVVGDELLVAIGQRIQSCVRQGDTVARLGGDEFAVLLDDVPDVREATRVAERILMDLSAPFHLSGYDVFTTASIGIALSSTGYVRPEDILRDADTAMYRAKIGGRSRYEVFDRDMHAAAVRTLEIETDLRRAVDRNEFRLHYQPIINLATGHISGFEALMRWEHPRHGLMPPAEFIPLAEETGLIVSMGWWVLQHACRQMQSWLQLFPDRGHMTISVNLSTKQFMQPDLLEQVDTALSRSGLPPQALKLEITESAVVDHERAFAATLAALRARGIQLCIDDFGTGYSSLSYLHSYPVDTLKIDRSFISRLGKAGSDPRLVETIIALSRNLGMSSVAEGVETAEQLAIVRTAGSEYAQGFLFSKACAADQIEELMKRDPTW